ncbi:MAG: HNH endonuclease [Gelidibacter sp.]
MELTGLKDQYFSHKQFYEKNLRGNRMYSRALDLYIEYLEVNSVEKNSIDTTLKTIIENENLTETEKQTLILSRVGQGKYRSSLIELWKSCSITQFDNPSLLIASHIKPWNESTNEERIDKYNGLLLLPTYDKLFDLGYITFSDSGNIIISNHLEDYDKLGVTKLMKIDVKEKNIKYLEYHRMKVFRRVDIENKLTSIISRMPSK